MMPTPEPFTLRSQRLGCLPIVNVLLTRMGLADHLATYLPANDTRLRLTPAAVIAVLVRNIVAGHRPVYALGEWAAPYDPRVLGLVPARWSCSTTIGSAVCWTGSSTATGPA